MGFFRALALIMGCLVAPVVPITAQTSIPFDPLALPLRDLSCQSLTADSRDSAQLVTVSLRFVEGEEPLEREIDVKFDSVGNPIYMLVVAPQLSGEGQVTVHAVGVRFVGDALAVGFRVAGDPGARQLTESELEQARRLSVWAWARRCDRGTQKR